MTKIVTRKDESKDDDYDVEVKDVEAKWENLQEVIVAKECMANVIEIAKGSGYLNVN